MRCGNVYIGGFSGVFECVLDKEHDCPHHSIDGQQWIEGLDLDDSSRTD